VFLRSSVLLPCLPVLNARAHGGVFVAAVSEYSLLNEWPDGWR